MKKSTFLHLRIPFSFFLLPVFLFAAAVTKDFDLQTFWLVFFILHVLIYPASNGYNSYFDKDEKSIGGLKEPPPVSKELYWVSLLFDFIGIGLALFISWEFALMLFLYGIISKAYSHPSIRLKKMPIVGWLAAGVFQGYFTYMAVVIALKGVSITETMTWEIHGPGLLSSLLLLGSYPMTQVYQHEEDASRGDMTMSLLLGIKGTFHFTALIFSLAMAGFGYFFLSVYGTAVAAAFFLIMSPVLLYFTNWYFRVRKNENAADFTSTMRLNFISAASLNVFFVALGFLY